MDAASLIRTARRRAGLSKRELARRAGTSPAAIVAYEAGQRDPTFDTLRRLMAAAGYEPRIELVAAPNRPSPEESARRLAAVLALAEHLPHRAAPRKINYPILAR